MELRTCCLGVFQARLGAKREQMTFGFDPTLAGSLASWPTILIAVEPAGSPKVICSSVNLLVFIGPVLLPGGARRGRGPQPSPQRAAGWTQKRGGPPHSKWACSGTG